MTQYIEKRFKSILNVRRFIDSYFWERYGINVYNGCQHGCIYCDSRSAKYHLPTDFENQIIVKTNVKQMLAERLSKARTLLPDIVGMSGASDPYHAAELKYQNTRQCLEVLNSFRFPVHILTKSKNVLRDTDLFNSIALNNWACVSVTITTANQGISEFLEPNVPSPDERFSIITEIKKQNNAIQSGVMLMPVIPFFTDKPDQLEEVIKKAKFSGADFVIFSGGMTLRDMQANWYLKHVYNKYPSLISGYERLYNFRYNPEKYNGNYTTTNNYFIEINKIILELCDKYSIPFRIKRFIPNDFRKINYEIAEKLLYEAYYRQLTGKSYSDYQWAGMNIQNLKKSIVELYKNEGAESLDIRNEIIKRFITGEIDKYDGPVKDNQLKLF